jgi:hypothetical protein
MNPRLLACAAIFACGAQSPKTESPRAQSSGPIVHVAVGPSSAKPPADLPRCSQDVAVPSDSEPYPWIGKVDLVPQIGGVNVPDSDNEVLTILDTELARRSPPFDTAGPAIESFYRLQLTTRDVTFDPVASTNSIVFVGTWQTGARAFLQMNAPDEVLTKALGEVPEVSNTGVAPLPGVRFVTWRGESRAFLRAHPRELVAVPPGSAQKYAALLSRRELVNRMQPGEVFREVIPHPARHTMMVGMKYPEEIEELRISIRVRADCGAALHWEGDCGSSERATLTAKTLRERLQAVNKGLVPYATRGLLDNPNVLVAGNGIKLRLRASFGQLVAIRDAILLLREP